MADRRQFTFRPRLAVAEGRIAALNAEIVSIGTELLLGEIDDTNATYISQQLANIGVDVFHRETVGDNLGRLTEVLQTAMGRSDAVILCGGLGPTADDITRQAIAEATNRPLHTDAAAVEHLKAFFAERHRTPTQSNFRQCRAPEGGELIPNTCGTAPGIFLKHNHAMLFAVPGPPPEMREMIHAFVLPRLSETVAPGQAHGIFRRTLRLADIGESTVADRLSDIVDSQTDPTIAIYASPAEVKVRIATKDADPEAARRRLDQAEQQLRQRLGDHVYGVDNDTMQVAVGKLLRDTDATVAVAESCTGGLINSRITDVPGASDYFLGGIVSYANQVKIDQLGVPESIIDTEGAVSEQCARAMAHGVRRRLHSDYGLATTGIAGPTGGTPQKPVGLVYIAAAGPENTACEKHNWPGTRQQFKQRVAQMALNLLRKQILAHRDTA